jgi:hypothetical protein
MILPCNFVDASQKPIVKVYLVEVGEHEKMNRIIPTCLNHDFINFGTSRVWVF